MKDTRTVRGTMDELKTLTDAAYHAGYAAGAAAENAACAAVCDERAAKHGKIKTWSDDKAIWLDLEREAEACADAIRARQAPAVENTG